MQNRLQGDGADSERANRSSLGSQSFQGFPAGPQLDAPESQPVGSALKHSQSGGFSYAFFLEIAVVAWEVASGGGNHTQALDTDIWPGTASDSEMMRLFESRVFGRGRKKGKGKAEEP